MIELRAECNKLPLAPERYFTHFLSMIYPYLNKFLVLLSLTVSVYRAATNNNLGECFVYIK